MTLLNEKKTYEDLLNEVKSKVSKETFNYLIRQEDCELENDFLGFLEAYDILRRIVPTDYVIIDLGCYMAAQALLFTQYRAYVGVDICNNLERFTTENTYHYGMSIKTFLDAPFQKYKDRKYFGICSYVPDFDSVKEAEKVFDNILIIYPETDIRLKINGEYKNIADYLKGEKL